MMEQRSAMSELGLLEARIRQLEQELKELPQKILRDVAKMVQMHTHELGGKVIWKMPVDELRRALEEHKTATAGDAVKRTGEENITLSDSVIITKEKSTVD